MHSHTFRRTSAVDSGIIVSISFYVRTTLFLFRPFQKPMSINFCWRTTVGFVCIFPPPSRVSGNGPGGEGEGDTQMNYQPATNNYDHRQVVLHD